VAARCLRPRSQSPGFRAFGSQKFAGGLSVGALLSPRSKPVFSDEESLATWKYLFRPVMLSGGNSSEVNHWPSKFTRGDFVMFRTWCIAGAKQEQRRGLWRRRGSSPRKLLTCHARSVMALMSVVLLCHTGTLRDWQNAVLGQVPPRFPGEGQPPRQPLGPPGPEAMGRMERGQQPWQLAQVEATAIVRSVSPRGLEVVAPDGRAWLLIVRPDAKVELLGTAEPSFLRPGQLVRFVAQVDRKRELVEEPVSSLLIFTPNFSKIETQLGVFPEEGAGATGQGVPGVGFPQGGGVQPGGSPPAPPARRVNPRDSSRGGATSGQLSEKVRLDIRGRLSGITKQGKLVVVLPPNAFLRGPVEVPLAENPEIRVDWSDTGAYMMAAAGDRVRAKGMQVGPNVVEVSELIIEKMGPLGDKTSTGLRNTRQETRITREDAGKPRSSPRTSRDRTDTSGEQKPPLESEPSEKPSEDPTESLVDPTSPETLQQPADSGESGKLEASHEE